MESQILTSAEEEINALKAVRAGSIDEFQIIVDNYKKILNIFVRQRVRNQDLVEDIVQDTFIKMYKNIHNFDLKKPLKPYLLQIATRTIIDAFRKNKIESSLIENVSYEEDYPLDTSQILSDLNPTQKNIFELLIEGYDYATISARVGMPLSTIKTIIRRTRQKFSKNKNL